MMLTTHPCALERLKQAHDVFDGRRGAQIADRTILQCCNQCCSVCLQVSLNSEERPRYAIAQAAKVRELLIQSSSAPFDRQSDFNCRLYKHRKRAAALHVALSGRLHSSHAYAVVAVLEVRWMAIANFAIST